MSARVVEPLLAVEGLKVHYPVRGGLLRGAVGRVTAVDGVGFTVEPGQTVGIVGESGSGKTTVAKCVVRLMTPSEGRIIFDGHDISTTGGTRLRAMRRHFQMIFQDPYASLTPHMTIEEIVSEPLLVQGILRRKRDLASEVRHWLELVGLPPNFAARYPHELSGGQRQRVAIARALVLRPRLVVCDEPVSALDATTQALIADLLLKLQGEFGISYVLISHDIAVVRYMSDKIYVMYLGQMVESGESVDLRRNPLHPYTQALWSAAPSANPVVEGARERVILRGDIPSPLHVPAGCRFHPRCPMFMSGKCDREEPAETQAGGGHVVRCHLY